MNVHDRHEAVRKGRVLLGTRVNYWAVLVAAMTSLVASAVYYIVLGNAWLTLPGIDPSTAEMTPPLWQVTGQFARNLVVATALSHLLRWLEVTTWKRALQVGLLVWFGFEAMAVVGSVLHEGYPLGLYLIHVGDALQATLLMSLVLGAWRRAVRRDVEISPSVSTSF